MSETQPAAPAAPAAPVGDDIALAIRDLVKVYGNLIAVADLSLDIPTGSFYGIVGPNGAGKTTTLTMATGLLTPDRGTAFVHGVDVWARTQEARGLLGVMPDGMRLLDRLSGPDFLVHVGMLHGLDASTARERAQELLAALDLAEAGKKLISDYSAGMTKKIALAAALIHSPRVLVLDEPFEAVDPVSAANIRQILTDYTKRGGTVILSSHVMATVQQLCTHVACRGWATDSPQAPHHLEHCPQADGRSRSCRPRCPLLRRNLCFRARGHRIPRAVR